MAKEKPRKKGYDYFEYFCASARYACQAAEHLEKSLANFAPETCREKLEVMHHIENAADGFRHDMTQVLAHEFIAPIEREDIIELAQDLDNVVDAIDDVMRRVYMFNVQSIRPEAKQFSALITKCCHALLETIEEFRHFKKSQTIGKHIIEVNTLESDGDTLHAECIRKLFCGNEDALAIVAWMTLFEGFEECLDACEDAVDVIESVIMKNT